MLEIHYLLNKAESRNIPQTHSVLREVPPFGPLIEVCYYMELSIMFLPLVSAS
jgi:hypothetical protein